MFSAVSDQGNSALASTRASFTRAIRQVGFKALLGWHYLVLFSPLLINGSANVSDVFFDRQLLLYVTLAVSFTLLLCIDRFVLKHRVAFVSPRLILLVSALACVATALSGLCLDMSREAYMATVVCLGMSEALIMFVWLHYYMTLAVAHPFHTLALDMVFGGIIAFVVSCLVPPANIVVAACLPLAAAASFFAHRERFGNLINEEDAASGGAEAQHATSWSLHDKAGVRYVVKRLMPTAIYAFVFGMVQGAFIVSGVALLLARDAFVFGGIVMAGLIVLAIPERPCTHADVDMMHRFSLLFFVCGVVGLSLVNAMGSNAVEISRGGGPHCFGDFHPRRIQPV